MPFITPFEGSSRRGRNLVDGHRAGVEVGIDEVGERAADIDANDFHGLRTPNVRDASCPDRTQRRDRIDGQTPPARRRPHRITNR